MGKLVQGHNWWLHNKIWSKTEQTGWDDKSRKNIFYEFAGLRQRKKSFLNENQLPHTFFLGSVTHTRTNTSTQPPTPPHPSTHPPTPHHTLIHTHTHTHTQTHTHTRHHLRITCHQNTHTKRMKIKPLELHLLSLPTSPSLSLPPPYSLAHRCRSHAVLQGGKEGEQLNTQSSKSLIRRLSGIVKCVAEIYIITSWASPFLFFIGKEQTNMAALWGHAFRSEKLLCCIITARTTKRSLQMELLAHFLRFQVTLRLRFLFLLRALHHW